MELKDNDIKEFVRRWRDEFNEELPLEQARIKINNLLELYTTLARRLPAEGDPEAPNLPDENR